MEYMIVSGESLEALVNGVNDHIKDGWKPTGGPFMVDVRLWSDKPKNTKIKVPMLVAQALIREKP